VRVEQLEYIEAVTRLGSLRRAADEQHHTTRTVRVGTVNAATVPLLLPVIAEFRALHPTTKVEVVNAQQADIQRALLEGGFDLGLVNFPRGDDGPPDLRSTELLRGRAVVCVRPGSPLAALEHVGVADLETVPLIEMRAGYVMHRLLHRFRQERTSSIAYSSEGAEMGKLMVAEGLGATLLPDFSIAGDPLERTGAITHRPLDPPGAVVRLMIQRRRTGSAPSAVRELHEIFVEHARGRTGEQG
jgi:DNA-binding transcriptional LysR family regulator